MFLMIELPREVAKHINNESEMLYSKNIKQSKD
jgi:hypothetical protein